MSRQQPFPDMAWQEALERLPVGYSEAVYQGRRYGVSKQLFNNGRSCKLYAQELAGKDFISLNCYQTAKQVWLKPCEMPQQKVIDFVVAAEPVGVNP